MNLLPILENGLFALGQVLRFPVFALLWVCVAAAVFMTASCVVDFVARRRERRTFDITAWLKSGPAIQASAARLRLLPAGLRQMLSDVEEARAERSPTAVSSTSCSSVKRVRRPLNLARMMVRVGPSLGLLGTLILIDGVVARFDGGWQPRSNGRADGGRLHDAIIGLATGTLAYVVAAARQNWVTETIREQRYLAEQVAREMQSPVVG